jgi:hypothetical protein
MRCRRNSRRPRPTRRVQLRAVQPPVHAVTAGRGSLPHHQHTASLQQGTCMRVPRTHHRARSATAAAVVVCAVRASCLLLSSALLLRGSAWYSYLGLSGSQHPRNRSIEEEGSLMIWLPNRICARDQGGKRLGQRNVEHKHKSALMHVTHATPFSFVCCTNTWHSRTPGALRSLSPRGQTPGLLLTRSTRAPAPRMPPWTPGMSNVLAT